MALELIKHEPRIDAVILDVSLGGVMPFPVADALAERAVPVALTTGYDASSIPSRYGHLRRCAKPLSTEALKRIIGDAMRR